MNAQVPSSFVGNGYGTPPSFVSAAGLFSLLDQLPFAVTLFDRQLSCRYANPAAENLFERSRASLIGAADVHNFFLSSEAERAVERISGAFGDRQTPPPALLFVPRNGALAPVQSVLMLEKAPDGTIKGVFELLRPCDSTADGTAIQDHLTRLEKANQRLREFAQVVAHDLQESVRKIVTCADVIVSKNAPESLKPYIEIMRCGASRMSRLVTDVLAYSQADADRCAPKIIDLRRIVEETLVDLESRIRDTKARVSVSGLPVINADPTQMRQLFQNLIVNALKFAREGVTPLLLISSGLLDGNRLEIRVADNGIGIESHLLEVIFDPFRKAHGQPRVEGSGVGLSICRRVVEAHRGRIYARSAVGQGTTMVIELPL